MIEGFKPLLADDVVDEKIKFPCLVQPKIDGIRMLNVDGRAKARSLKDIRNVFTQNAYSLSMLANLDGELVANAITHPDLCRLTTSATSTIAGEPYTQWWLFDYFENPDLDYVYRYEKMFNLVTELRRKNWWADRHLRIVPSTLVDSMSELLEIEQGYLNQGYEGIIIRDPSGRYKFGRSSVKEGYLLRIKRFIEEEADIISFEEGKSNTNELEYNELGYAKRSSHQDNMVPNGMIGNMKGTLIKDVKFAGKVILRKGDEVTISPGSMTHKERKFFFENPEALWDKRSKFRFFPHGVKDKPRFPQHVCFVNTDNAS